MNREHLAIGAAAILQAAAAAGQQAAAPEHRLGDHPAVVVQRLEARRGYDYASKFYPHPAWLYLRAQPPEDAAADAAPRREASATGPRGPAVAPDAAPKAPPAQ